MKLVLNSIHPFATKGFSTFLPRNHFKRYLKNRKCRKITDISTTDIPTTKDICHFKRYFSKTFRILRVGRWLESSRGRQ